jgi:hypothetical protein
MVSVLFIASAAFAQGGGGRGGPVGLAAGQQQSYNRVKNLVMGSAKEMPDEGFAHKPGDTPRTFAQVFAHISDTHYNVCATASGQANPNQGSLEMTIKTKAEVLAMLEKSYGFCDSVFAALTDTSVAEMVQGGRGGPRARGAILSQLLEHDNEMYGISTVYLRTNGRVPPASQGRGRGGRGQ